MWTPKWACSVKIMSNSSKRQLTKMHTKRYYESHTTTFTICIMYKHTWKIMKQAELGRETMFVGKLTMCSPIQKISYRTQTGDFADRAGCYRTLSGKLHLTRVQGRTDLDPLDKLKSKTTCFDSTRQQFRDAPDCHAVHTLVKGTKR